jgi:hypothetical protein
MNEKQLRQIARTLLALGADLMEAAATNGDEAPPKRKLTKRTELPKITPKLFRKMRIAKNHTLQSVGALAGLGLTTVSRYELGKGGNAKTERKLALALQKMMGEQDAE